jgi:hypothetical protein
MRYVAGADTGTKFRRSKMYDRIKLGALLLVGIGVALPMMGCGSAQVDTLNVTPATITMAIGTEAQLTATGVYAHGSGPSTTQNLTNQVTWSTASVDVATVSSSGMVTATGPGLIQITASIQGYTGLLTASAEITVPQTGSTSPVSNDVAKLTITPGSQTVAAPGDTATFTVVGTTAAGAQINVPGTVWSSSSTQIATIDPSSGIATGVGPGTATIEATYTNQDGTVATGTATITVNSSGSTDTDITAITVIPGSQTVPVPGDTATYVAVGTMGSGAVVSLQQIAIWSASTPQIATINPQSGVATAVGQGTTTITAQVLNKDGTTATGTANFTVSGSGTANSDVTLVSIIPTSQTVASPGDTATFTATGTTVSGVTQDLNGLVWNASSPEIATIASNGVATAVGQGTSTISAQYTNPDSTVATGTATFTVTGTGTSNKDIVSITIIPGSQSVPAPGDTAAFLAVGTTASGSTVSLPGLVSWSSSSLAIASVSPSGIATGVAAGTATISATMANADGTLATGTASFTVIGGTTENWTALTITPSSNSISAEQGTANFIALGTNGSGEIMDVTTNPKIQWSTSIPGVATVGPDTGIVTGVSVGTTQVTAELENSDTSIVEASATVTTTLTTPPEPILSLTIIPPSITVLDFQLTGQFLAVATYSSAPYVRDVTNSPNTTWLSSEPEIFPVDTNSGGTPGASAGLVTSYGSGGTTITAESVDTNDGTIQSATATFLCPEVLPLPTVETPSCYPGEPVGVTLLETLTIYNEGLNTNSWMVTAPSATGTADVLHCGPGWTLNGGTGGSVCTSTYPTTYSLPATGVLPVGAAASCPAANTNTEYGILLTAQGVGTSPAQFGGFSDNCSPTDECGNPSTWTAAGPNYCVVNPISNDTVGVIFN